DRNKEWNPDSDKSDKTAGVLDWLKKQTQPYQPTPPTPTAAKPVVPGIPEEHFVMELLEGSELKNVDFSRRGKEGRWLNNSATANGTAGAAPSGPATGAMPSLDAPGSPGLPEPTSPPTPFTAPTTDGAPRNPEHDSPPAGPSARSFSSSLQVS